jgi:cyclopropane fatty-acyl-phospholipid synthase-like methyltransferase
MPSGVLLVAERTVTLAGTIQPNPQRILDVGAGYGKHGVLLREYLDPTPVVHGVEAWEPYVEAHRLRGIYDHLYTRDALTFTAADLLTYDLIVMGDVIEHFEKEDAFEFLNRAANSWMVIATPVVHFHTDPDLPPTERHLSHWTRRDFEQTGRLDHYEECYGAIIVRLRPVTR